MQGLMQDWPLTVDRIIDHAARWHGDREVVSREQDGSLSRTTWGGIRGRAAQLSHALAALGVQAGDRVATLMWNRTRHIEAWYSIMGMGAVCHTLNPRLFADQIVWIMNHAADSVLIVDADLLSFVRVHRARLPQLRHVIVAGTSDGAGADELDYDTLLAPHDTAYLWGGFDENTAAGLCYTSGTTGDPKGVLYSHRSNTLHAFMSGMPDILGMSARDTILPVVPLFHANAWGLAFLAPMVGAKMVLPGCRLDPASLVDLIEQEGVTFTGMVPTVWLGLLDYLRSSGRKLETVNRGLVGGSACPASVIRAFDEEFGVRIIHGWGMTELSPLGSIATPTAKVAEQSYDDQLAYRASQGRPPYMVNLRIVDDAGNEQPRDGVAQGQLQAAGPFVVERYFGQDGTALDGDGFFSTGDIAAIDPDGFVHLTDRAKDVIKSGGEWISSVELENAAVGHPAVAQAAAIAIPHPRWGERPRLLIELRAGTSATPDDIRAWLEDKVARWWLPDEVVMVERIPLGATGKIDKKAIRAAQAAADAAAG